MAVMMNGSTEGTKSHISPEALWNNERVPVGDGAASEMTSEAIIASALAAAPNNALLRRPFIRKLYLIQHILLAVLFLVPYWTILYSIRANRPRRSWTLQRCLRVRWSRLLCGLVARCEIDYLGRDLNLDLDTSSLIHSHAVTIPSAPSSYLVGHPAETLAELHRSRGKWIPRMVNRVDPSAEGTWGRWNDRGDRDKVYGFEQVKAFWYTGKKERPDVALPAREPGAPVGIHFHGGGYLCGTAAETDLTSSIAKALVKHSPLHHILAVDYRLAPLSPWPLPLLDAISAYVWLVTHQGVYERDIILVGDSAGGHLALALARFLRDSGPTLGLSGPGGLVLLSPWVDVGFTTAWGEGKYHNASSDLIDDTFGPFATSLLLRALPAEIMHTDPYISPASLLIEPPAVPSLMGDFPPIFLVHGTAERLETSINIFWDRLQLARQSIGGRVSTTKSHSSDRPSSPSPDRVPDKHVKGIDCVHDFMIFPWQSVEAGQVYSEMDEWLRGLLFSGEGEGSDSEFESDDTRVELPVYTDPSSPVAPASVKTDGTTDDLPSPSLSPLVLGPTSPEISAHPAWSQVQAVRRARQERRISRQNLMVGKSPVLAPTRPGVVGMMDDMRSEAMSYIDLPAPSPLVLARLGRGLEVMSPLTLMGQVEQGEWDWRAETRRDQPDTVPAVSESRTGRYGGVVTRADGVEQDWYELGEQAADDDEEPDHRLPAESRKER